MKYTNLTDNVFWDAAYLRKSNKYFRFDPLYGDKGILNRTLAPWIKHSIEVLELGCGASRFLMYFNLVAGLRTYGLDFSRQGLQNLEEMAKTYKIYHELYYGDLFEADLCGKKYDIVFHAGLAEHFKDLNCFFSRCRFFCKPGGLMIFFIPNMKNHAWSWHNRICPKNYKAHIHYSKNEIIQALEPFFTLLETKSWGYLQLYAGGPPETIAANVLKYMNYLIIILTTIFAVNYKGNISQTWAGSLLFICKAKG